MKWYGGFVLDMAKAGQFGVIGDQAVADVAIELNRQRH